jgi:hypothetical protein
VVDLAGREGAFERLHGRVLSEDPFETHAARQLSASHACSPPKR